MRKELITCDHCGAELDDIYDWRFQPAGHVNEMDWDIKKLYTKK